MKVFCSLLVLLAVFHASQSKTLGFGQRSVRQNLRTTFNRRFRNVDPLIVGGQPADIANFPFQLALLDLTFGGYICGASNISPGFALSAGEQFLKFWFLD
jgi:secreted trypsin-like serine protease